MMKSNMIKEVFLDFLLTFLENEQKVEMSRIQLYLNHNFTEEYILHEIDKNNHNQILCKDLLIFLREEGLVVNHSQLTSLLNQYITNLDISNDSLSYESFISILRPKRNFEEIKKHQNDLNPDENTKIQWKLQLADIFEMIFLNQKKINEKRKIMFSNLCFDIQTAFNLLAKGKEDFIKAIDIIKFVDFKFNELEINDFLISRFAKTRENALCYTDFSDFIFLGNYFSDHVSPSHIDEIKTFERKLEKSTKKKDLENSINKLNNSINDLIKGLSSKRFSSLPSNYENYHQISQRSNKNTNKNAFHFQRESTNSLTSRKIANKKRNYNDQKMKEEDKPESIEPFNQNLDRNSSPSKKLNQKIKLKTSFRNLVKPNESSNINSGKISEKLEKSEVRKLNIYLDKVPSLMALNKIGTQTEVNNNNIIKKLSFKEGVYTKNEDKYLSEYKKQMNNLPSKPTQNTSSNKYIDKNEENHMKLKTKQLKINNFSEIKNKGKNPNNLMPKQETGGKSIKKKIKIQNLEKNDIKIVPTSEKQSKTKMSNNKFKMKNKCDYASPFKIKTPLELLSTGEGHRDPALDAFDIDFDRQYAIKTKEFDADNYKNHNDLEQNKVLIDYYESPTRQMNIHALKKYLILKLDLMLNVEKTKETLLLSSDFSMINCFRVFEENQSGFISKLSLKRILTKIGLRPSDIDLHLIFKDFDSDKDNHLSYDEFYDLLMPSDIEISTKINKRSNAKRSINSKLSKFSKRTIKIIGNIFESIIKKLREEYNSKKNIISNPSWDFEEAFYSICPYNCEYFIQEDLREYLEESTNIINDNEISLLFKLFDKDCKLQVNLDNFIDELSL